MSLFASVGDEVVEDEKLVILLGSLSAALPAYDAIVKIIKTREHVDLYEAYGTSVT